MVKSENQMDLSINNNKNGRAKEKDHIIDVEKALSKPTHLRNTQAPGANDNIGSYIHDNFEGKPLLENGRLSGAPSAVPETPGEDTADPLEPANVEHDEPDGPDDINLRLMGGNNDGLHKRTLKKTNSEDQLDGAGVESRAEGVRHDEFHAEFNRYQISKHIAQGMMDLALLSANANQLRYVLESASTHPYYITSITFITLSIFFQIAVGIGLILNSHYEVNRDNENAEEHARVAYKINNWTVAGVFMVTILNVFITSFSVSSQPPLLRAALEVEEVDPTAVTLPTVE